MLRDSSVVSLPSYCGKDDIVIMVGVDSEQQCCEKAGYIISDDN